MAKLPWLAFYPTNWRSDPALAMCSEGSRLLWFEMLLVMHEAEPRGFLVVNGRSPDPRQIAMLTRTDPARVEERLAELAENGVFSRNRAGVIYSRKMVRDEKKAETARKNGVKGGNPTLRKQKDIPPSDNLNGPEPLSPKNLDTRDQSLREDSLSTDNESVSPAPARETAPPAAAVVGGGDERERRVGILAGLYGMKGRRRPSAARGDVDAWEQRIGWPALNQLLQGAQNDPEIGDYYPYLDRAVSNIAKGGSPPVSRRFGKKRSSCLDWMHEDDDHLTIEGTLS